MGTNSIQLSCEELEELRQSLIDRGIPVSPGNTDYELFRVSKKGFKCVAYLSGRLTYSSSLELNNIMGVNPSLTNNDAFEMVGGTDEAGKGEWFGPLVVAIVMLEPNQLGYARFLGAKDSKLLSTKQILRIEEQVKTEKIEHKVLSISPPTYNGLYEKLQKENKTLNDLLAWGHAKVIKEYSSRLSSKRVRIVVDVFDEKKLNERLGGLPSRWLLEQRTHAETEIPVALASILARARFLRDVSTLEDQYGVKLFKATPSSVPKNVLSHVAKLHFSNVQQALRDTH